MVWHTAEACCSMLFCCVWATVTSLQCYSCLRPDISMPFKHGINGYTLWLGRVQMMCFVMIALPLGCDKAKSDIVLLNVVALASLLYILMPWHFDQGVCCNDLLNNLNVCSSEQWICRAVVFASTHESALHSNTGMLVDPRSVHCVLERAMRQSKGCSAFYSCWLWLWDKYRWISAQCRSETGLLQSWCGISCWLAQLPSECKLQKPVA